MSDLQRLIAEGESETLELKRSTGQLNRAGQTLCGFLNHVGGSVVIGVLDDGRIVGQEVSDKTRRELALMLGKFEPPAPIQIDFVELPNTGKAVIVLEAPPQGNARPFTFDGRAYQRVQTTTSVLPQDRYETMLLERAHVRRRWENQAVVGVRFDDLDHEEILQTREAAIRQHRISAGTSTDVGDILDRLGLRREGVITQAAQVLFGTRFLPDYPQALLKMGRFRGTKITGDILDNKQVHLNAFTAVRESLAFLERTLPLSARFPAGQVQREDRLPVPFAGLREIILNAVMHRDYSDPAGRVAISVFDYRIEIRSAGMLPNGITAEDLSGPHRSVPRNPLIAETFHRTGAVEIWGRGTNRVIEACADHGIQPPVFEERDGAVVVTFFAQIGPRSEKGHQVGTKSALSRHQVQVIEKSQDESSMKELLVLCGRADRTKFRNQVIRPLLEAGLLRMTIPEKPTSSRQRYKTTQAGEMALAEGT